ncbi:MAG: hypothetical protein LQ351_004590 [Letrouitia transgressa]|nr:MAG: hypothetical protein LQ351_004590 [Letrouitia transgressa]
MAENSECKHWSLTSRVKEPSPLGTTIWVGLRAADAALQYALLRQKLASELVKLLGGRPVVATAINGPLGLTPHGAILTAITVGASLKHAIWALFIKEQKMTPSAALAIVGIETLHNTINTFLSAWAITSAAPTNGPPFPSLGETLLSSPILLLGATLSAVGLSTELYAEFQRKWFKDDPKNEGKPYGGGLWSLATHINYGAYTLWKAGYATAAAGPFWGGFVGAFFFYDFTSRAIPELDEYCTEKVSEASR